MTCIHCGNENEFYVKESVFYTDSSFDDDTPDTIYFN
jgi:hypothetical protein